MSAKSFIMTLVGDNDKNSIIWKDRELWVASYRESNIQEFIAPRSVWVKILGLPCLEFSDDHLQQIVSK